MSYWNANAISKFMKASWNSSALWPSVITASTSTKVSSETGIRLSLFINWLFAWHNSCVNNLFCHNLHLIFSSYLFYTLTVDCGNNIIRLTPGSLPVNLSSPLYPNPYAPNFVCTWFIFSPEGFKVQVDFIDFDVTEGRDFLRFNDFTFLSGNGTGVELPSRFTSPSKNMWIQLRSGQVRPRPPKGFLFQLSAVNVSGK